MILTHELLEALFARSARGEGVRAVLAEWGCDDDETLESLKQHTVRLRAAKAEYQRRLLLSEAEREELRASDDLRLMAANVEAARAD